MSHNAPDTLVQCNITAGVARLRIDRPERRNALSSSMLRALLEYLEQIASDDDARVVVLESAGQGFCAGFDLAELAACANARETSAAVRLFNRVARKLQTLPQPVIARVQGLATAGGCQLVSMCDLVVAADEARFATSSIDLGLFGAAPAVGLSRCIGRRAAFEMLLTGESISAHEALRLGLVNRVVPLAGLDAAVASLAASICAKPAAAVRLGKQFFHRQMDMGVDAAHQLAAEVMAVNFLDDEARQAIRAFLGSSADAE